MTLKKWLSSKVPLSRAKTRFLVEREVCLAEERVREHCKALAHQLATDSFNHVNEAVAASNNYSIERAREHAEAAAGAAELAAVRVAREHAEAAAGAAELSAEQLVRAEIAQVQSGLRRIERLIQGSKKRIKAEVESDNSTSPAGQPISELLYAAIEERFRGSQEEIRARQEEYLSEARAAWSGTSHLPMLDIACGRGEWMSLLSSEGFVVQGIDSNSVFVAECEEQGFEVSEGDALATVSTYADDSFSLVSLFHLVEHLPLEYLESLLGEIKRVLHPDGCMIIETPNCASLSVAASTFWIDPTHPRPLHPEVLAFLIERTGFTSIERRLLHPVLPSGFDADSFSGESDAVKAIANAVFGYGDIAFISRSA
jgi:2-polyprenyl-3-methyl-5-hydroxy-6-metoxy-1,4-benzoquinol methylase